MNVFKKNFLVAVLLAFVPLTGFAQSQSEKPQAPKAKDSDNAKKTADKKDKQDKQDKQKAQPEVKAETPKKPTPAKTEKTKPDSTAKKEDKTKENKAKDSQTPSKTSSNTEDKSKNPEKSPSDKTKDKSKANSDQKTSSAPKTKDSKSSATSEKQNEGEVETLEVTGSYIRRSDVEGPSPIVVVDRKMIEKSGFNYVGQVLNRHTSIFPFGGGKGLRGLGSRQLILVNGQRGVGINSIPITAVDRVEILTDGASATYGSDAMSGVINVITRKDWDGLEVATKFDTFEYKGNQTFINSASYGKSFSKGNVVTSLQHVLKTSYRQSDIKRLEFASDYPVLSTNYQTTTSGGMKPSPDCTRFNKYGHCQNAMGSKLVSGPSHDLISLTDAEYKIGDLFFLKDSKFYSTLRLNYETYKSQTFSPFFSTPVDKKITNNKPGIGMVFRGSEVPSNWRQRLGINGPVKVYHSITEMPEHTENLDAFAYGLIAGLKGYIGSSDWILDITFNNQFQNSQTNFGNYALFKPVKQAVINGTYDPFGSARNTDGFGTSMTNTKRNQINWLEIKSSGDLGSLLGFDWASAFGINIAHFEFQSTVDDKIKNREVLGSLGGRNAGGERQLYATFAELSGLYRDIEVQLAVRGDMYSDFGSTVNPKLGVMYQPLNWLGLRASFSTGFIAPSIDQIQGAPIEGAVELVDAKGCKIEGKNSPKCREQYYAARIGGNPNLKEETSQNFNAGIVLSPFKNLDFTIDYWNVTVNDIIGTPGKALLRLEAEGRDFSPYGNVIRAKPKPGEKVGEIEFIEAPTTNMSKNELHGVDFSGLFKMTDPFFKGSLTLGSQFTYMFHFHRTFAGDFGREMFLGQSGSPRWRNVATLSYSLGPFSGQLLSRSFSKMEPYAKLTARDLNVPSIPGHTQFDLSIDYIAPWGGRFQFGSINFFNDAPVYEDFASNRSRINSSVYNGERSWFLAYRHEF